MPDHANPVRTPAEPPNSALRFDRTLRLYGKDAMDRLGKAHVAVFGLGGVGSFAVEGLARSGVGRLTLVDYDQVCVTNVNRQLHALDSTLGELKADAMASRARLINPAIKIQAHVELYGETTSQSLLAADVDYVIDAIDNVTGKLHLLKRCLELRIPVVSSMGAGGRVDPTQVRVNDLSETHTDQFAKDVRKYLRKHHGIPSSAPTGILAVWSAEKPRAPMPVDFDEAEHLKVCPHPRKPPLDRHRQINGTAAFVTSVFGMVAASVAVNHLVSR